MLTNRRHSVSVKPRTDLLSTHSSLESTVKCITHVDDGGDKHVIQPCSKETRDVLPQGEHSVDHVE